MNSEKYSITTIMLKEIKDWWDKWNTSENDEEIADQPIQEAKNLLSEIGYMAYSNNSDLQ